MDHIQWLRLEHEKALKQEAEMRKQLDEIRIRRSVLAQYLEESEALVAPKSHDLPPSVTSKAPKDPEPTTQNTTNAPRSHKLQQLVGAINQLLEEAPDHVMSADSILQHLEERNFEVSKSYLSTNLSRYFQSSRRGFWTFKSDTIDDTENGNLANQEGDNDLYDESSHVIEDEDEDAFNHAVIEDDEDAFDGPPALFEEEQVPI